MAVAAEHPANLAVAAALAAELHLPLATIPFTSAFTRLLVVTPTRLELRTLDSDAPGPVYVDFIAGAAAHRRRFGGGRGQPLARAIGLKGGAAPTVADVTAGLGRDAFVLACLGCTVWLIERSPVVAVLLRDGLRRAAHDAEIGQMVRERLHFHSGDGRECLPRLTASQRPDVVYLDPMYPHRQKSAWVGKEMRLLRQLAGDDADAPSLLAVALTCAGNRVVVKRPRLAPALSGPPPTARIVTPNTRFDLYRVNLDSPAR
ncbi:MAG: class I SAM-dependent methyltransferase [Candidatus Competibacteraceae bacterium]|nr:MAG: class I SAM-dependent methyltransferase [Candidatus Competibacteraceae bacterium]